jgi:hypothetical protein
VGEARRVLAGTLPIYKLAALMRRAWSADTAWIDDWHPRNPSRGQCGSSSLVLQDLLGGALMQGLVEDSPGPLIVHYWNHLAIGEVDVTWGQFDAAARIVHAEPVDRGDLLTNRWFTDHYEQLRARVARCG